MKLNRVVVTGYGLTSPIGNTPEEFWNSLKEEGLELVRLQNLTTVTLLFIMQLKSKISHLISTLSRKIQTALITYSLYALYAAQEAVNHAGLDVEAIDKDRFGVIVASGIGGIKEIEDQVIRLHEKGPKRVKPMTLPKALPKYGIW